VLHLRYEKAWQEEEKERMAWCDAESKLMTHIIWTWADAHAQADAWMQIEQKCMEVADAECKTMNRKDKGIALRKKHKFVPDLNNPNEVRLRKVLDKKIAMETKRQGKKRRQWEATQQPADNFDSASAAASSSAKEEPADEVGTKEELASESEAQEDITSPELHRLYNVAAYHY
jgi:hypothetical protein